MPFGRRLKPIKKCGSDDKQPIRYQSGNWNPVSAELQCVLNKIPRPQHMIEAKIQSLTDEYECLNRMKTALARRMNELRIEEMRISEILPDENEETAMDEDQENEDQEDEDQENEDQENEDQENEDQENEDHENESQPASNSSGYDSDQRGELNAVKEEGFKNGESQLVMDLAEEEETELNY